MAPAIWGHASTSRFCSSGISNPCSRRLRSIRSLTDCTSRLNIVRLFLHVEAEAYAIVVLREVANLLGSIIATHGSHHLKHIQQLL